MSSADDLATIKLTFTSAGLPDTLVAELINSYRESKKRFHIGDLRPHLVEGGRFSEACFRILQWATNSGTFTPLGSSLPGVPSLLSAFAKDKSVEDSLRLHVPRVLQAIYEIRNNRNGPHLGAINVNSMDATLVIKSMDWVLAELVRIYSNLSPEGAQALVDNLISKEVPAIQMFDGQPRVLKNLSQPNLLLVLLYWRGASGASRDELSTWLPTQRDRSKLGTNLNRLSARHLIHDTGSLVYITAPGERDVERTGLVDPV